MINQETTLLIKQEADNLVTQIKSSLGNVQRLAIGEAWKILQILSASIIQIIEKLGSELSSPEKKELSMQLMSDFYDKIFLVVDIPVVPNLFESIIHKYVKSFLMILVSASIDALVTTFRQTGVFLQKTLDKDIKSQSISISLRG